MNCSIDKVVEKKTQVELKYKVTEWVLSESKWYYMLCTWFVGMAYSFFSSFLHHFFVHFEIFQWKTLLFFFEFFLNFFYCLEQYWFHSTWKWLQAITRQMNELKMSFGLFLQVKIDFIIHVDDESTEKHIQLVRIEIQFTFLSFFPKWKRNVRHSMISLFG